MRRGLILRKKVNMEKFSFIKLFLTFEVMKKYFYDFCKFIDTKILILDDYEYAKLMTNYENKLKNFKKFLKIHYPGTTTVSLVGVKNVFEEKIEVKYDEWYKWHMRFLIILKNDLYKGAQCNFQEWSRMNYAVKVFVRSICNEDTKTLSKEFFIFLDNLDALERDLYLKILNSKAEEIDCIIRLSTSKLNNEWYEWENKKKPSRLQNTLSINTCDHLINFFN